MLRTHIVSLALSVEPRCPDECVACGAPSPGAHIRVSDRVFVAASLGFSLLHFAGKKVTRSFPICLRCRRHDRLVKWGRIVTCVGLAILVVSWTDPWMKALEVPRGTRKFLLLLALAPLLAIGFLWSSWFPRAVTIDAEKHVVNYQFARREYATAFARWNEAGIE